MSDHALICAIFFLLMLDTIWIIFIMGDTLDLKRKIQEIRNHLWEKFGEYPS